MYGCKRDIVQVLYQVSSDDLYIFTSVLLPHRSHFQVFFTDLDLCFVRHKTAKPFIFTYESLALHQKKYVTIYLFSLNHRLERVVRCTLHD